jgi:small subunit ribosomal protein S8e
MSYYQGNDTRLITGGTKGKHGGKKKHELGGPFAATTVTDKDFLVKKVRARGGQAKLKVVKASYVNVADGNGKTSKLKILGVEKTPANVEYARRGIITKGAVVRTEAGLVKITSRPGQTGVVNGIVMKDAQS